MAAARRRWDALVARVPLAAAPMLRRRGAAIGISRGRTATRRGGARSTRSPGRSTDDLRGDGDRLLAVHGLEGRAEPEDRCAHGALRHRARTHRRGQGGGDGRHRIGCDDGPRHADRGGRTHVRRRHAHRRGGAGARLGGRASRASVNVARGLARTLCTGTTRSSRGLLVSALLRYLAGGPLRPRPRRLAGERVSAVLARARGKAMIAARPGVRRVAGRAADEAEAAKARAQAFLAERRQALLANLYPAAFAAATPDSGGLRSDSGSTGRTRAQFRPARSEGRRTSPWGRARSTCSRRSRPPDPYGGGETARHVPARMVVGRHDETAASRRPWSPQKPAASAVVVRRAHAAGRRDRAPLSPHRGAGGAGRCHRPQGLPGAARADPRHWTAAIWHEKVGHPAISGRYIPTVILRLLCNDGCSPRHTRPGCAWLPA